MPRGIPNQPKRVTAGEPEPASAAPMIIIQPQAGATRLDAYNLALSEIVDELRRAIIHLVAMDAGVAVISHTIPRDAAVAAPVAHSHSPAPGRNGARPKTAVATRRVRQPDHDEDDL